METDDLPPKTVKAQLVRLDDNLKRIERTQFAGIQRAPGSLPVLEAFQMFLENERRIARRRLLVVTAAAMAAILIMATAAGLYIHHALRNAGARTDELATTTAGIEESLGSLSQRQAAADARLAQAAQTLAEQQQALAEQAGHLARQQQASEADQQERSSEVIRLREQIETLLADQESIRRMLARGAVQTPARTEHSTAEAATATIGPVRRREEVEAARTPVRYSIVTLAPEGRPAVRWMLPIANVPE